MTNENTNKKKKLDFKTWELTLLVLAVLLTGSSLTIYISGYPLRNYLFGLQEDATQSIVGNLADTSNGVKREMLGDAEFKSVVGNDVLFAQDTIVTSENGHATVTLRDGSTIELGPKTMVRLEGEDQFDFTGVHRTTRVQVVSGEVSGKAAEKSHVVIRTRDRDVDLTGKAQTVTASASKPVISPPRQKLAKTNSSMLSSLLKNLPRPSNTPPPVLAEKPRPTPSVLARVEPSPKPSPSPTVAVAKIGPDSLVQVHPLPATRFAVDKFSPVAQKKVQLNWKLTNNGLAHLKQAGVSGPAEIRLQIFKDKSTTPLLDQKVAMSKNGIDGAVNFTVRAPGNYAWEISVPEIESKTGFKTTKRAEFVVLKEFEGIQLHTPEGLRNQRAAADELRKPQIKLSWDNYPGATSYQLKITAPNREPIETNLKETHYILSRADIGDVERNYQISVPLSNGFVAKSAPEHFLFDFTPPDPVRPPNRAVLTADKEIWKGNGILMTWQKTGISEAYILEIAQDAQFRSVVARHQVRDNFFLFKPNRNIQNYWWRVSAFAKNSSSRPSAPFEFKIEAGGGLPASSPQNPPRQHPSPQDPS